MEELDQGRRLARRRMAWISFWFLILVSSAVMLGVLLPGGQAVAAAISTAMSAIVGIYTVFTSIILGYLGVSVAENIFKK